MKKYFIDDSEIYMDTIQRKNHPFINYGLINSYTQIINNDSLSDDNTQKALLIIASGLEDDNWLQTTALVNAIKLNIEIPEEITTNRLKEYYSRFEVMEALVNNNQKDKIPSKYLASKEFSKLSIYNAAGYDYDEYPDIINYLGDVTYNDEVYHVYNYGNSNGDLDSELYLAYAIAKDADVTNFVSNTAEATYYLLEEDWKLQTTTYLKSLENNEE